MKSPFHTARDSLNTIFMPRPITPSVAADAIIELIDLPGHPIVLIERRYPPYGWAIPGGFMDVGETIEHTAIREALEETGLAITLKVLLGCYSDPSRDQRGQVVSAVYIASACGTPKAMDDALHVGIFKIDELPTPLAFDHATILADYRRFLETGSPAPLRPPIS